jgi:hypothetical protein
MRNIGAEAHPRAVKVHNEVMEAQPGVVEAHNRAMVAHPGAIEVCVPVIKICIAFMMIRIREAGSGSTL